MKANEIKFMLDQLVKKIKARLSKPVWIRIDEKGVKIIEEEEYIKIGKKDGN